MRLINLLAGVLFLIAMGGCASWKLDKTIEPKPDDVAKIGKEIEQVRAFQEAVFDVSTFAVDRCEAKTVREPFALMTIGPLSDVYKKERLAAYYRADGLDEKWRVLWAAKDSPLTPGTPVTAVNGTDLDADKRGVQKYLAKNIKDRRSARDGDPYIVTLADGQKHAIPMIAACDVEVWSVPIYEESALATMPVNRFQPVVIPQNAIHMAKNRDEMRYLAGLAVYYGASSESVTRRRIGGAITTAAAVATVAMPVLYLVASPMATILDPMISTGGMQANAAEFATKVVADMGGDPSAGINLMDRLVDNKLKATRVLLSDNDRKAMLAYIATHSPTEKNQNSIESDAPAVELAAPEGAADSETVARVGVQ